MTVVWVVLAVLAAGGLAVFSLARRRRARPAAGTTGGRRWPPPAHPARAGLEEGRGHGSD
jgi:hypothetical protein